MTMSKPAITVTSGNYFMQLFTYLIVLTMVGLVGTWWYRHTPSHSQTIAENQLIPMQSQPLVQNTSAALPIATPKLPTPALPATNQQPIAPVLAKPENTLAQNTNPTQIVKPQTPVRNDEEENEPDNEQTD